MKAALPFFLRSSRRFLSGPPDVRWHSALRSQLLGVGGSGVGRKRSVEGRPESARVSAEPRALTPRHVPPSACILLLNTQAIRLWPLPLTQCWESKIGANIWKRKAKTVMSEVCSEDLGSRSCVSALPSNNGGPRFSADDHECGPSQ